MKALQQSFSLHISFLLDEPYVQNQNKINYCEKTCDRSSYYGPRKLIDANCNRDETIIIHIFGYSYCIPGSI